MKRQLFYCLLLVQIIQFIVCNANKIAPEKGEDQMDQLQVQKLQGIKKVMENSHHGKMARVEGVDEHGLNVKKGGIGGRGGLGRGRGGPVLHRNSANSMFIIHYHSLYFCFVPFWLFLLFIQALF
ncbi:hypothetical protein DsansV1_C14g0130781 [Dioscorea sansibarensis]